jgi:5'-methylthioadenosine phosphorylase
MKQAIIGGTGFYGIPNLKLTPKQTPTRFGTVELLEGEDEWSELVFLPRHGPKHEFPPHRINYRANMLALKQLGVERALAIFTVGSLHEDVPPHSLVALDQFIDFTHGRESTYFDGGGSGLVHTMVTEPFCPALRQHLLEKAPEFSLQIHPTGTYVCVEGPRFETAAEVRMFAQLGGHVVGMTGIPEIPLARELGIHYAAVAISVNWGAGLKGPLEIDTEGIEQVRSLLLSLFMELLRSPRLLQCSCESSAYVIHPSSNAANLKKE